MHWFVPLIKNGRKGLSCHQRHIDGNHNQKFAGKHSAPSCDSTQLCANLLAVDSQNIMSRFTTSHELWVSEAFGCGCGAHLLNHQCHSGLSCPQHTLGDGSWRRAIVAFDAVDLQEGPFNTSFWSSSCYEAGFRTPPPRNGPSTTGTLAPYTAGTVPWC